MKIQYIGDSPNFIRELGVKLQPMQVFEINDDIIAKRLLGRFVQFQKIEKKIEINISKKPLKRKPIKRKLVKKPIKKKPIKKKAKKKK